MLQGGELHSCKATVALKGHHAYLICFIRRSFNRRFDARKRRFDACNRRIDARNCRFDARTIVDSTLVTVDSTLVQSSIRRLYNRRFDACTIVDSTLVQPSILHSFNRRFDARDRRFDACKTSTLFDACQGIKLL